MPSRGLTTVVKAPFASSARPLLRPATLLLSLPTYRTVLGAPQPQQPFKVWPFLAILALGSGTYVFMVKSRVGQENKSPRTRPRNTSSGPGPSQ